MNTMKQQMEGRCECGCGETTTVIMNGPNAGQHHRFIHTHYHRWKRKLNPQWGNQFKRSIERAKLRANALCLIFQKHPSSKRTEEHKLASSSRESYEVWRFGILLRGKARESKRAQARSEYLFLSNLRLQLKISGRMFNRPEASQHEVEKSKSIKRFQSKARHSLHGLAMTALSLDFEYESDKRRGTTSGYNLLAQSSFCDPLTELIKKEEYEEYRLLGKWRRWRRANNRGKHLTLPVNEIVTGIAPGKEIQLFKFSTEVHEKKADLELQWHWSGAQVVAVSCGPLSG